MLRWLALECPAPVPGRAHVPLLSGWFNANIPVVDAMLVVVEARLPPVPACGFVAGSNVCYFPVVEGLGCISTVLLFEAPRSKDRPKPKFDGDKISCTAKRKKIIDFAQK